MIRPGNQDDVGDVLRILGAWPTHYLPAAYPLVEADFRALPSRVFEEDGRVAGFLVWIAHAFEMELLWMAVDPQSTRRGIGRQLVDAAMHTVCTQRVVSLKTTDPDTVPNGSTLSAAGFRGTVGFFQHLGFRVGARLGGYWGSGTDAMLLFKELR